jgi:hypothetical protein
MNRTIHLMSMIACVVLLGSCGGSSDSGGGGGGADGASAVDVGRVDVGGLVGDVTGGEGDALAADGADDEVRADAAGPADGAAADAGGAGPDVPGFEYECEPGEEEACLTACQSAGQRICWKEWGPCVPPDEFCGNCADDDCDGAIDEGCPGLGCDEPPPPTCPVAVITIEEGGSVGVGATLHLSGEASRAAAGAEVERWQWSVQTPPGAAVAFVPGPDAAAPTFAVDLAGPYLFQLEVWDEFDVRSCQPAQAAVTVVPYPPVTPAVGCADGEREGFLDLAAFTRIAGCSGAWQQPGITPDSVRPTCGRQGGDDGPRADGAGCSSHDLCAEGWHVCSTWREVAAASPSGCVGATPPDARPKSLFFAIRQPSANGSVCGEWGDGDNDVFGCGNLGHGLPAEKGCGPLDRVLASTQPNSCGYNEAEPNLGPWQCLGPGDSHLHEGALVTKVGCPNASCSYDGYPVSSADKGGVLCCRD